MPLPDSAENITIANIPTPAQGGPAQVTQQVEHNVVQRDTVERVVPSATPGQPEAPTPAADYGTPDPDDEDFFLKDIQRAETADGDEPAEAPVVPAAPAAPERSGTPAAPTQPAATSQIDTDLLNIAESFGVSREEAESFGTPQNLIRALNVVARNLPPSEEPKPSATPAPAAVTPEPALDFPNVEEMQAAGFDPNIIKMASSLKALHDRTTAKLAKLDELEKVMPNLVGEMQRRQAEARDKAVDDSFREAGYDAKQFDKATIQKIVARVSGLYKVYKAEGVSPPVSQLIQTVMPLVVPNAKTNGTSQAPAVPVAAAAKRRADAAARAKLMERNGAGQFRGLPTHRAGGITNGAGSALRQALIDRGYDPGESGTGGNDGGGFLPG